MSTLALVPPPSTRHAHAVTEPRIRVRTGGLQRLLADGVPVSWEDVAQLGRVDPLTPGLCLVATYGGGGGRPDCQLLAVALDRAGVLVKLAVPAPGDRNIPEHRRDPLADIRRVLATVPHVALVD